MATLEQLLKAIEKNNSDRLKRSASSKSLYKAPKGAIAPYTHSSVVNPKTSKGSEHDGPSTSNPLDIVKNLGHDVVDTVHGIPGGIIQTIHHPVGTIKAIGADYKRRYSPLLSGDFGKFGHEVAQHPLAPLLDLASVATAGGGLAAKVGQSARVAGAVRDSALASEARAATKLASDTAPARKTIATLTKKADVIKVDRKAAGARASDMSNAADVRKSSMAAFKKHSDTIAKIQAEVERQSKSIETATKATTEAQRTAKLPAHIEALVNLQKITTGGYRTIAADKASDYKGIKVAQANNPVKRLRQNLGISAQESRFLPQQTPLIGLASRAKKAANLQRDLEASRLRPTQRMVKAAEKHMAKVAGKDAALHQSMDIAAQNLIDGVDPRDYARLVKDTRSTQDEIAHSAKQGLSKEEHHALTDTLAKPHLEKRANELYRGAQQYFQREAIRAGRVINPIHLQHGFNSKLIDSPEVGAIVKLQKAHEAAATHAMQQMVDHGLLKHDEASTQAVLHTNLVRAVKGQAPRDFATTKAAFEKAGLPVPSYNPDLLTFGEGNSRAGMLRESKGTLYSRGTKVWSPMNIVMRHELASKATDLASAHKLMLSAARHFAPGTKLPKGYVWVKDSLDNNLEQKNVLFRNMVVDGHPVGDDYFRLLETEKRPKGGYAIRKDVRDDLAAGRKAMSAARAETLAKGITAWKFLVLTRPAFLVHNVISNQLMYQLKNGWNFAAFRNMKEAFKSGAFDEHHHAEGMTFGEEVMGGKPKSKLSKAVSIFYKATAQHEHWLRQLTAYETARKLPEVQRELRALKGGKFNPADFHGRTMFHEAYNRAIDKSPHVRDLVTRNMDDTLGNYRYYTQQERMLKNISPFYGWERHSVRNMVRMMEDNPVTMAMLTQLGMVGNKKWNKDFGPGMPDFVKTYVEDSYIKTLAQHLGLGDKVSMYDFNSTNPWTTAVDVGKSATDPKALISNMGPLVTGPLETLTKKSALTGAPSFSRFDKYSPIAGALDRIVTQTPPVTAWDAFTSKKNESKKMLPASDEQVGLQQSGFDFRNLNKKVARKMQKQESAPKDKYGNTIRKKKKSPFYK